jgi:hypothetical protein
MEQGEKGGLPEANCTVSVAFEIVVDVSGLQSQEAEKRTRGGNRDEYRRTAATGKIGLSHHLLLPPNCLQYSVVVYSQGLVRVKQFSKPGVG